MKGKIIACFVALPHHTRFLWPINVMLENMGARIIYFTTMSDYPYEMALAKEGKECKILQSYANNEIRENIDHATKKFFGSWVEKIFEWDGYKHWPFVLQSQLLVNGFEEYFCLEEFIRVEKPDMFIALHERNRWGKIIGHLATKHSIPYVTLQEGDYYEDRLSFSGHTEYSTALLLWGKDTEDRLARLKSSSQKFVRTGNTHLASVKEQFHEDEIMQTKKDLNIPCDKKVVLFLVGLQWGVVKEPKIWEGLLQGIGDDVVKIFKWHPKVTYGSFKKNIEELFKDKFSTSIVLQNYDPYKLLYIADYCVTLGKTTLAVEALSFGKTLFSLPGTDGEIDHYAKKGIAQPLSSSDSFAPLYNTIRDGVPEKIERNVEKFINDYFYKSNSVAIERSFEVIEHILRSREQRARSRGQRSVGKECVSGRISYIIPSGDDAEALLATLTSLSQKVTHSDWEVVVVVSDPAINEMLSGISGDIRIVESKCDNLAVQYNNGAEASSGEYLIFLKPGMLYYKDDGLLEAAKKGVAGMPIKNKDNAPYCLGIGFDFNHVPYRIQDSQKADKQVAVGGGLIGVSRDTFETIGGFDEEIACHLLDADICLSAREAGLPVIYLKDCLGFVFKETFVQKAEVRSHLSRASRSNEELEEGEITTDNDDEWKGRIGFFAKWVGKLPKDDDYISFAGDLLKV